MTFETLTFEQPEEGIAVLSLNRPNARNAINFQMVQDLHQALDHLAVSETLQVLILQGTGGKAFAAGADIGDLLGRTSKEALLAINQSLFTKVANFPYPTIAAVQGYALGGGCELTMACDLRVAGESAKFGLPEVTLGIIPAAGGTQRLVHLVGVARAKELIFTGKIISAEEASVLGLVNAVIPDDKVQTFTLDLARSMAQNSRDALRLAKISINAGLHDPGPNASLVECLSQALLFDSEEKRRRMTGYLEKRTRKESSK